MIVVRQSHVASLSVDLLPSLERTDCLEMAFKLNLLTVCNLNQFHIF